jgi:hypothetical protein
VGQEVSRGDPPIRLDLLTNLNLRTLASEKLNFIRVSVARAGGVLFT